MISCSWDCKSSRIMLRFIGISAGWASGEPGSGSQLVVRILRFAGLEARDNV